MNLNFAATIFTLSITTLLPIALILFISKKDVVALKWAAIGGMVFYLFQIATRIPALNYLSLQPWYIINISNNTIVLALFLAFTAGLFEEGGRYIAFRWVLRDKITWQRGIAFGIGHGGIEAIYLVGLPFLQQFITEMSSGSSLLLSIPPSSILLAGAERFLAMIIHVGLSLIVLYGIKRKKSIYLLYAILAHTLVNAPIVLVQSQLFIWGYLVLCTLTLLYITITLRSKFERQWFYK